MQGRLARRNHGGYGDKEFLYNKFYQCWLNHPGSEMVLVWRSRKRGNAVHCDARGLSGNHPAYRVELEQVVTEVWNRRIPQFSTGQLCSVGELETRATGGRASMCCPKAGGWSSKSTRT